MFKLLFIVLFIFALLLSPVFRCFLTNPHFSIFYTFKDIFYFFKYRSWRCASCGELVCFTGLFGCGKTLSAVHKVVGMYKRYNNKVVFDKYRKKYVTQLVVLVSNVDLVGVPYTKFESLKQLVEITHKCKESDDICDTLTYIYCLGDEFSVQLNSRSFKTNIDPLFLNTLLTCRHYHLSIYYTAQRFNQVDALLRQVTQS